MDKQENHAYWSDLARDHGAHLAATTKCRSIKVLEIEALARALRDHARSLAAGDVGLVVEIGCGNGMNILGLQRHFPHLRFVGVDYVPDMVRNAATLADEQLGASAANRNRLGFGVMDVREFCWPPPADAVPFRGAELEPWFSGRPSVVFSDRCLINLATVDEQVAAIERVVTSLAPGGLFLMLENSHQAHSRLNDVRKALGLEPRAPAPYNVFIDEEALTTRLPEGRRPIEVRDFGALHDLILYGAQARANGGAILYDTPLMEAVTTISLLLADRGVLFPDFGQNRLWVFRAAA